MWKFVGLVGAWISLLAFPHIGPTMVDVNFAGVAPPVAVSSDDLDDPPLSSVSAPPSEPREIPGSFATIHFENALGKTLSLVEARLTLDGQHLPAVTNLAPDDDAVVYAGRVSPGHHLLGAVLVCRGNRRGPFTYLKEYTWEVASDAVLTVPEDNAVVFTVSVTRHKGMNVPLDKQVGITVHDHVIPSPLGLAR